MDTIEIVRRFDNPPWVVVLNGDFHAAYARKQQARDEVDRLGKLHLEWATAKEAEAFFKSQK